MPVEYVNYYDEDSEVDEEEHVEVVVGSKGKTNFLLFFGHVVCSFFS